MTKLLPRWIAATTVLLALAASAFADDYPSKPVRLIIPFPPGGSNDVVGRLVAQQLSVKLGQQVYVDNRAGAGGMIGTEACATATPDGYTICVISIAHAVNPALYTLKYDPIKSFTPISIFATGPNVLVVNPTSPIKTVKDLLKLAKAEAGRTQLRFGRRRQLPASGRRTVQTAGARQSRARPVQRRRPGDAGRGRRSREDHVLLAGADHALHQIGPAASRWAPAAPSATRCCRTCRPLPRPACPVMSPTIGGVLWRPAGLPKPIAEKLYRATQAALKSPELQAAFDREGAATVEMSSAQFADYIQAEIAKWGRVVKEGNIHAQ